MARHSYDVIKRLFDVVMAGVAVIILSPLIAAIAILVKTSSPGPIFYLGERIGKGGAPFKQIKFRTMRVGSEKFGPTTALGDFRIIRGGHFLRKYKLDEIPQLFNVLRGEMSLVGPRPEVEMHTKEYSTEEQRILDVLPGITDYASIHFVDHEEQIGAGDPEEANRRFITQIRDHKNKLRLAYVDNRSFLEDLRILWQTGVALARKIVRFSRRQDAAPPVEPEQQPRPSSH